MKSKSNTEVFVSDASDGGDDILKRITPATESCGCCTHSCTLSCCTPISEPNLNISIHANAIEKNSERVPSMICNIGSIQNPNTSLDPMYNIETNGPISLILDQISDSSTSVHCVKGYDDDRSKSENLDLVSFQRIDEPSSQLNQSTDYDEKFSISEVTMNRVLDVTLDKGENDSSPMVKTTGNIIEPEQHSIGEKIDDRETHTDKNQTEGSISENVDTPNRRSVRSRDNHDVNTTTSNLPSPKSHVTNCGNGHHCIIHKPTSSELESLNSFGTYIREVVLPAANMYEIDKNHPDYSNDFYMHTKMELSEGMALIRLPKNFGCSRAAVDRTGRGPHWRPDTVLGDWPVEAPIEQLVNGIAGVYEYTLVDQKPMTISSFRERADKYMNDQIGNFINRTKTKEEESKPNEADPAEKDNSTAESISALEAVKYGKPDDNNQDVEVLERQFWKRLGPTMIPAWYGADQEGSLFYPESEIDHSDPTKSSAAATWSLSKLDSCLQVLPPIPGVTTPYLYVGMWGSVFCAHTEDMNLLSINYLHAGAPKIWYSIAEPDAARFLSLAEHYYGRVASTCKEFLRHKRYLLSPAVIQKAGIKYQTAIQYPGDAVVTMPGGYHFGFNIGFNVAEATNFGVPEWIPFGKLAKVCLCRPDSVRIDMYKLTQLIQLFQKDQKRNRRLRFAEWRKKRDWLKKIRGIEDTNYIDSDKTTNKRKRSKKNEVLVAKPSDQQKRNEFWIEVMKPLSADGNSGTDKNAKKKRKRPKNGIQKNGSKNKNVEIWHLAKPINKSANRVVANSRVLCIIPASQNLQLNTNAINSACRLKQVEPSEDYNEDDIFGNEMEEQCFAGQVVELQDGFARIHLVGLPRTEDIWLPTTSSRLFLDGGQWSESNETDIPALHYWNEMDSKKRIV